jgi:hypothetical protein
LDRFATAGERTYEGREYYHRTLPRDVAKANGLDYDVEVITGDVSEGAYPLEVVASRVVPQEIDVPVDGSDTSWFGPLETRTVNTLEERYLRFFADPEVEEDGTTTYYDAEGKRTLPYFATPEEHARAGYNSVTEEIPPLQADEVRTLSRILRQVNGEPQ